MFIIGILASAEILPQHDDLISECNRWGGLENTDLSYGCIYSTDTVFSYGPGGWAELLLVPDTIPGIVGCQLLTGPGWVEDCRWFYDYPVSDTFVISWVANNGEGVYCQDEINIIIWYISVVCGDANSDDNVNVGDAVYLINYIFKGGSAPDPECLGDANGDGHINVGDAVYLINYVFKGGPAPLDDCCLR
jgi:hypothetical protein